MRIFGILIALCSILCLLIIILLLGRPARPLAQGRNTLVYLPYIAAKSTETQHPTSSTQEVQAPVTQEVTATPGVTPTATEFPPEAFPSPIPYIPAPLPPFTQTTNSKLGYVNLTNLRPIKLPIEQHSSFGVLAWSPDGKQFIGHMAGNELIQIGNEGRNITGLYLGNTETGELQLWQANGGWPSWSRDGKTIYYLAVHGTGKAWIYDLYRRDLTNEQPELIRADVGCPYFSQPAAIETATGDLIFLDKQLHPARQSLAKVNGDWPEPQSLLSLVADGSSTLADQKIHFSISLGGRFAALLPSKAPIVLLDLQTEQQIGAIDRSAYYASNVAWSIDDQLFAYTDGTGVYVYNLTSAKTTVLVTRKELGFHIDDWRSGFGLAGWSPDQELVLFIAGSWDWNFQLPVAEQRPQTFSLTFAATKDGGAREVIAQYTIESVSPGSAYAIVEDWNSQLQLYEKYVADIQWN